MATLLQLRTTFVQRSGRTDLASADYTTDAGADWFINEGIRELDGLLPNPISRKTLTASLAASAYSVSFANLRVPINVWATDSDSDRWLLGNKTERDMRSNWETTFDLVDTGSPTYWSIGTTLNSATPSTTMALTIMPPADAIHTIEVEGYFWSTSLAVNTDTNWWSVNHPGLCYLAAQYALEVSLRNTAGMRDWMGAIELRLRGIDHDAAETEAAGNMELSG